MNLNWQDIAVFALVICYAGFERWVSKAYPKPMITLQVGRTKYKATNVSDIQRLIELEEASLLGTNAKPTAEPNPPEAKAK